MYLEFEQQGANQWALVASFARVSPDPATTGAAGSGGSTPITGTITVADRYIGCLHCRANQIESMDVAKCGKCKRLSCFRASDAMFHCPYCEHSGPVSGGITGLHGTSHSGGGGR
jgi:hypothetical protein